MGKVIVSEFVEYSLKKITKALYENEYFAYIEDSENYVQNLREFFLSIPEQKARKIVNKRYGNFYCKYKHNNKTTWYVGFDTEDDVYLIKFLTNNHSSDYPKFISMLN
jgi:hypothetical protein